MIINLNDSKPSKIILNWIKSISKKFDKKTRYNIKWRNNQYMRKTAKHYLFNQVRSSFLNITADEMAIAIFLPVARFKKGRPY